MSMKQLSWTIFKLKAGIAWGTFLNIGLVHFQHFGGAGWRGSKFNTLKTNWP